MHEAERLLDDDARAVDAERAEHGGDPIRFLDAGHRSKPYTVHDPAIGHRPLHPDRPPGFRGESGFQSGRVRGCLERTGLNEEPDRFGPRRGGPPGAPGGPAPPSRDPAPELRRAPVPLRTIPSLSAAAWERSRIRSPWNGPRSLTRTTICRPVSRFRTRT